MTNKDYFMYELVRMLYDATQDHQSRLLSTNTKHGNLFRTGDTIFNYGTHFPLLYVRRDGRDITVYFNITKYSRTTSKIQTMALYTTEQEVTFFAAINPTFSVEVRRVETSDMVKYMGDPHYFGQPVQQQQEDFISVAKSIL